MDRLDGGASVRLHGKLVESRGGGQAKEFLVDKTEVLGGSDPEVSPARHDPSRGEGRRGEADWRQGVPDPEEIVAPTRASRDGPSAIPHVPNGGGHAFEGCDDARLARLVRGGSGEMRWLPADTETEERVCAYSYPGTDELGL